MEYAAREAEHKQQRWLTPAASPRADHHYAELTVPPITALCDGDVGDDAKSLRYSSMVPWLCSQQKKKKEKRKNVLKVCPSTKKLMFIPV